MASPDFSLGNVLGPFRPLFFLIHEPKKKWRGNGKANQNKPIERANGCHRLFLPNGKRSKGKERDCLRRERKAPGFASKPAPYNG